MADIETLLNRWQSAGVLDAETASRVRAYESRQERPAGLRWQGMVALILGAILLSAGVVLFVAAHWDELSPGERFTLALAVVVVFHAYAAVAHKSFHGLSTALHAVGTVSTGAAIALVGQIFNMQEHWPDAILLWTVAALAGWVLLRDEPQQALTLLLFPAWLLSQFAYAANEHVGEVAYIGRLLITWAVLYLTVFLGSRRKIVQGILFGLSAMAISVGIPMALAGWPSWSGSQTFLPLGARLWGWTAIAVLPLAFSLFRLRKSLLPVAVALAFSVLLPWCTRTWTEIYYIGDRPASLRGTEPNLAAHALVAAFALFIIGWGVRQSSRSLVNLGIVGFAFAVGWFYFSNIFDMVGRSLGLIGLGVLFLAGGWALEKMRRRLISRIGHSAVSAEEAP